MERVDAVVIGAGLGGLAAAAVLAREGRHVIVLEQHSVPGGYAQCFQRGPYRFDASLHALNGLAPGGGADAMYQALGIWDRLSLKRLDPLYRLRLPDREVVAHADPFRYESELVGQFPAEAVGIRAYLDEAQAVHRDTRRVELDQAAGREPSLEQLPARHPALVRVSRETWDQMMARNVSDEHARAVLGALWAYTGLPPSTCAAVVGATAGASYHEYGGWYPEGGSQALSNALADVIRVHGGELRHGQLVTGIELSGEQAMSVSTREGLRLEADVFISNASAPSTMLNLVGRDRLPADYVARVEGPATSYTTFSVFLGLARDLFAEQGLGHELFLAPSYDTDATWHAAKRGEWSYTWLVVTDYTSVDPGCAPAGQGAVVLTTAASFDYEGTWGTGGDLTDYHLNPRYLELKEQAADALVARAAEVVPGLVEAIRFREASTPLTNIHYTRNPGGAIEGYENSPANSGLGRLPSQTPVGNLLLAGAWTNSGGMNPAIASGVSAARQALRQQPAGALTR